MVRNWQLVGALAAVTASAGLVSQVAVAQDGAEAAIDEIVTIGSRSHKARSVSDSTVPIDVISGDDFNALGSTADLTDNLKAMVPSFTATPATGDGSAFVRPTSLRGTAPDQTLVLVNGKRRHRSALVQFFAPAAGNGAQGVDIGMIPGIALKSVEVLRDGAASQYGSDAIAGVINFVMKDASEGGDVQVQYGQFYEGEDNLKVGANVGFGLGADGFVNLSFEYTDNDALSRGIQRQSAVDDLLAAGVDPSLIGADAPFGDAPFLQTWGRPETSGLRFFLNSGFDLWTDAQLYARLGYADTEGRYRFFYRNPDHSSLAPARAAGFTGLPAGFTPFLDGDQTDLSFVTGIEGEFSGGMFYDFSFGYGKNELDYFLNNTVNPGLALDPTTNGPSQMGFDVGGYEQEEINLNADFSLPLGDSLNLAFGAEWRDESFTAIQGEPNSFVGAGSSGFAGIPPDDAGEVSRDNWAAYVDVEHDITDAFLMQYALRYEDFSDFGSTVNGKVAARIRVAEFMAFRGAVSTGFHAPTPGQASIRSTITTFDGVTGLQVEEGLIPPTSPAAVAEGGTALTEETSVNYSVGMTTDFGDNTTLTIDLYQIEVDDRIYRTGDIPVTGSTTGATISFYTNALDVEHQGVDVVLTSGIDWSASTNTDISFAFSYNKVKVTGQSAVQTPGGPVTPVSDSTIEDIENNYPNERFVLTANTFFGDAINLMVRANYYGDHYDERGTIAGDIDANGFNVNRSSKIDSTVYFDVELGWQMTDNWRLAVGAVNIFDEFIGEINDAPPAGSPAGTGSEFANRIGVGLQYPRRSAANYEGGSWYLKAGYSF